MAKNLENMEKMTYICSIFVTPLFVRQTSNPPKVRTHCAGYIQMKANILLKKNARTLAYMQNF